MSDADKYANLVSDADEYANLDINAVLEKYSTTYPTAFKKNWGYNAIFIDEAQDIKSTEMEWIEKMWLKHVPGNKLWMFGDADQNVNKFRGVFSSLINGANQDYIQKLTTVLRPTVNIFNSYHEVWYQSNPPSRMSQDSGTGSLGMEITSSGPEALGLEASSHMDINEETNEQNDSGHQDVSEEEDVETSSSEDEDTETAMESKEHCDLCKLIAPKLVGQETEIVEIDIGPMIICKTLADRLVELVNKEKLKVEDVAILCVNHEMVDFLSNNLIPLLTGNKERLTTKKTDLKVVSAKDFATKCTKIKTRGRKRTNTGNIIQKKFLMIDTVRKFKGLQAEVTQH